MNLNFLRRRRELTESVRVHVDSAVEFGTLYFDSEFYEKKYPDIKGDALSHWLAFGLKEGRSPHPLIDLRYYRSLYPDILAGTELQHYLNHGWIEGRQISPYLVDVFYRSANPIESYIGISILEDAMIRLTNEHELNTGTIDTKLLGSLEDGSPLDRLRQFVLQWDNNIASIDSVDSFISICPSPDAPETLLDFEIAPNDWIPNATLIIPVHADHSITRQLLMRISASCKSRDDVDVYVIADGCPNSDFVTWMKQSLAPEVKLIVNESPKGFAGAVNCGVEASPFRRNIIIVNADILVRPQVFTVLLQALESDPELASVSSISNFGSIASYPAPGIEAHWLPVAPEDFGRAAEEVFQHKNLVETPFALGHLFIVRRNVWDETGGLNSDLFPDGYGEEVKWSLDSTALGWKHAVAPGAFAWHVGSTSFESRKSPLKIRAERILQKLGNSYQENLARVPETVSELTNSFAEIEAHLLGQVAGLDRVIITHDRGGGTHEHIDRNLQPSQRDLLIFLESESETFVVAGPDGVWPNIVGKKLPLTSLSKIVLRVSPKAIEFHTGTSPNAELLLVQMISIASVVRTRVVLHDFGPFCGRISLMGGIGSVPSFCGGVISDDECQICISNFGSDIGNAPISRVRSLGRIFFEACDSVEVPSKEAGLIWAKWGVITSTTEHQKQLGVSVRVTQRALDRAKIRNVGYLHGRSMAYESRTMRPRILIPGRISEGKGARLVSQVVQLNRLYGSPLSFVLCGGIDQRYRQSADGFDLILSNYQSALPEDLKSLQIDAVWISALAAETYMYTLDDVLLTFPDIPLFVHATSGAALRRSLEMWPSSQRVLSQNPGNAISEMFEILSLR